MSSFLVQDIYSCCSNSGSAGGFEAGSSREKCSSRAQVRLDTTLLLRQAKTRKKLVSVSVEARTHSYVHARDAVGLAVAVKMASSEEDQELEEGLLSDSSATQVEPGAGGELMSNNGHCTEQIKANRA